MLRIWLRIVAGTLALSAPATAAISPAIQQRIAAKAKTADLSGTLLVQRDGAKPFIRSFGLADRAFRVPATSTTKFRVASITKLFTSTMILMLAEAGKLGLDEPVGRYLSDFDGPAGRVTIRQLLNHTSGIAQYDRVASLDQALNEGLPNYEHPMSAEAMLKACCQGELVAEPGTRFDYNNADYLLLGRIIERLDGRPYAESLQARLLGPLHLANSGIANRAQIIDRLAPSYFLRPDTKTWMNDLPIYFENWDAAGGMYSTPQDVASFASALFAGRLIKPASLDQLLVPGLDDYGLGLWSYSFKRNGRSYRVAKRPGRIMGANAVLYRLLDEKISIVILANTNQADLDEMAQRIAEILVDQPPGASSS